LSRSTSAIIVLDRHRPQTASTAASTSLLQWEFDTPLRELSSRLGVHRAIEIYRASALAVREILALSRELNIACHCSARPSLYVAGNRLGRDELIDEERQRQAAGLPFGYGGNEITFSAMAARLIAEAIAGRSDALLASFAIDRN
jgi:glycine/D-amino acid oxidase-like deaminating enzyme